MISYELARKLHDAGFQSKDNAYIPTLEELIEACGDRFAMLGKNKDGWRSMSNGNFGANVEGTSPDEAVANLWLILNKK